MIGSRHPSLARLRRLSRRRSARTDEGACVIDGPTLLADALAAGWVVDEVVAEPDAPVALLAQADRAGARVHQAPAGSLARAVDMVTPQSLAAVAQLRDLGLDELLGEVDRPELMVVLVAVNDPGNAGTLLRSAEAAGAGAVVFCDDSVDPYNPKCVRASAGSLFRLPVVRAADAAETLAALRGRGIRCVGTVTQDAAPYDLVDWTGPAAVVLGNEAHGLPPAVEPELDEMVTIPMRRSVESLNVAMAGTLVCFEAARQRRAGGGRADSSNNSRNRLDDASSSAAGFSAA